MRVVKSKSKKQFVSEQDGYGMCGGGALRLPFCTDRPHAEQMQMLQTGVMLGNLGSRNGCF